ncbi:hypothetical protein [Sphingobium sp.]|uniref:hypothetical protein n=1 Tax=Sphingobium sp. TaxID=1912891 RepID=UPI002E1C450F
MAKFVVLRNFSNAEILVNVELIRVISEGGPTRTLLTFDHEHEIAVQGSIAEVYRRLSHQ